MTHSGFPLSDRLRLLLTPGIGSQRLHFIRSNFESVQHFIECVDTECVERGEVNFSQSIVKALKHPSVKQQQQLATELQALEAGSHQLLYPEHPDYPKALAEIADAPELLWVSGDVKALHCQPNIALVGARDASHLGHAIAKDFAHSLALQGFTLVSGMAKGIDRCVHEGALAAKGVTVGVLGTGIDQMYPAQNTGLKSQLLEHQGALISEFPLGTPPKPTHFPKRNRIISGLSKAVVVVEATLKSGSLVTARLALEQGREVCAVPGAITSALTAGCHQLIQQGATLVTCVEDIVETLAWFDQFNPKMSKTQNKMSKTQNKMFNTVVMDFGKSAQSQGNPDQPADPLDGLSQPLMDSVVPSQASSKLALSLESQAIMAVLGIEPVSLDDIVDLSGLNLTQVLEELMALELSGLIECLGARYCLHPETVP